MNTAITPREALPVFRLSQGDQPLLLSLPHVGTAIPEALQPRLHPRALQVEDTDWHLERLYSFAHELGASVLVPTFNRYVIDLNRPADNQLMYPGANNTELCPTRFFTGEALYKTGEAPGAAEVEERIATYWRPYHEALQAELARIKGLHGHAVLFDAHSIKSELPWLFEGRLWDLNLGTASGASCDGTLESALTSVLAGQSDYSQIVNGRFKGGHITRCYGQPTKGVHAVQLEMCWRCYMEEAPPHAWNEARAQAVTPLLRRLVQTLLEWRP
jgi:N-formylglutamate deformylase